MEITLFLFFQTRISSRVLRDYYTGIREIRA